jgi:hypothetical protein
LLRREGDVAHAVTFLPGFPDGSFGWAKVLPYLDLVEAIWRDLSVQSTTPVAFDFSTLVVLEHLRCRLERSERGEPLGQTYAAFSCSMAGSSRTGTPTRGTRRRCCAGSLIGPAAAWAALPSHRMRRLGGSRTGLCRVSRRSTPAPR